jgi:hypothetical protein
VLLLELIAFGEARCFGATDAAELLEYCIRQLDLYAAHAAGSLGVDMCAERALLGCWVLGAAMLLSYWVVICC